MLIIQFRKIYKNYLKSKTYFMRNILILLAFSTLIISCSSQHNKNKEKELELKERELALKEKELALKYSDSISPNLVNRTKQLSNSVPEQKLELPFIGKREFDTRPGFSGTGTPSRNVEILQNGDVYFEFVQVNRASGEVTEERYYAGKFKTYMKCFFKKWDNEVTYYKITKDKIYEVDKNNKILRDEGCCSSDSNLDDKCPCESNLY